MRLGIAADHSGFELKLINGYRQTRGLEYMSQTHVRLIEWLRMPGDVVFIVFGVIPMLIATGKTYGRIRAGA